MARLEDAAVGGAAVSNAAHAEPAGAALAKVRSWTRVLVVQGNDQSLKFVVPADWQPGVFACRITAHGATTAPTLLNEPDPWWLQGDEGEAATAGGWLRVLGKSLAGGAPADKPRVLARLEPEGGPAVVLTAAAADGFSLRFDLPGDLPQGTYRVRIHNGSGGEAAWSTVGPLRIVPRPKLPAEVFDVLATYGEGAAKEMRNSLVKYNLPIDRTAGIQAALKKRRTTAGGPSIFRPGATRSRAHSSFPITRCSKARAWGW